MVGWEKQETGKTKDRKSEMQEKQETGKTRNRKSFSCLLFFLSFAFPSFCFSYSSLLLFLAFPVFL